nr:hypothetical protein [Tanacetum cinerariifolium]
MDILAAGFEYSHAYGGNSTLQDTTMDGFKPSSSCSSQNTQLLANFCGSQMQSQSSGQYMMPYLHSDSDVFQKYSNLSAGNARPRYTAALKGNARPHCSSNLPQAPGANSFGTKRDPSDVLNKYSQLCARNVTP